MLPCDMGKIVSGVSKVSSAYMFRAKYSRLKYVLCFRCFRKNFVKATVSVVVFVCPPLRPSVHMELGSHWTDFY